VASGRVTEQVEVHVSTTTERQVAHIWRRLGFGATGADVDHGVAIGPKALVNELLRRRPTTPAEWKLPSLSTWQDQSAYLGRQLELMATSPNPLQERLAWILQGIVVVGVSDFVQFDDLRGHLTRLRVNPFGSYTKLLRDTAVLPGMMNYLDGFENSADHPNQNYARELMELFSLGLNDLVSGHPNYSQGDVVQVARALTGYTYDWTTGKIVFDPASFDHGQKHFFGVDQGDAGTPQVITAVSRHPSYRHFIPARLYLELVGRAPDLATLKALGRLWGTTGDVRAVVSAIAHSSAFLAPAAIGSRVKSPVELIASGARALRFPLGASDYGWQMSTFMNQHPFFPPNVAGWPEGTTWLNAGVDMTWGGIVQDFARASAASTTGVAAELLRTSSPTTAPDVAARLCGIVDLSPTTARALHAYTTTGTWDRIRAAGALALVLVAPEFLVN
jgi:uncharacterized protein (DUF1800 family)